MGGISAPCEPPPGTRTTPSPRTRARPGAPPQPLRQTDSSLPLLHPCSPCPIYQVGEGETIFLFHNHDGHFGGWGPQDGTWHRRPVWLARGLFRPGAVQPIWFSEPVFFMDHGGVPILRGDLAMYASLTYASADSTTPPRRSYRLRLPGLTPSRPARLST